MTAPLYTGAPVILNGTTIQGITKQNRDLREVEKDDAHSGSLHVLESKVIRAAPVAGFSSLCAFAVLALLDNANTPMVDLSSTGLKLHFPAGSMSGPDFATSGHVLSTTLLGQAYLSKLAWAKGGDGLEAEVMVYGRSTDGIVKPTIESAAVTIPDTEDGEIYTLVSCTLPDNKSINCESLNIDFAHGAENNSEPAFHNGLPYPVHVVAPGGGPNIKITATLEITDLGVVPAETGAVVFVFKKYGLGGALDDSSTKTITLAGCRIKRGPITWGGNGQATRSITVTATRDDTTLPFTVS